MTIFIRKYFDLLQVGWHLSASRRIGFITRNFSGDSQPDKAAPLHFIRWKYILLYCLDLIVSERLQMVLMVTKYLPGASQPLLVFLRNRIDAWDGVIFSYATTF